jgi:putative tricarboxylic transport membrane protein
MRKLQDSGITEEEVARAESFFAGATRVAREANGALAADYGRNYILALPLDNTDRTLRIIPTLTAQDLRNAARHHLAGDNYVYAAVRGKDSSQAFTPSRPVELVVHSAPGGGSDVFAHAVVAMANAEKLLSQPMRVVNRTAGASAQAMEYLAQKRGDGHTIAVFTNTWIATPLTRKDSAHTVRDFTPVVRLVLEPTIVVVRGDSSYRNMGDFIAAAKRQPGALKQAGGSLTAIESLTGLLIQSATGAKWTFISTPAVSDRMSNLLAGKVDIVIPQPQDANEHIASGKLRPIAAITERRLSVLPDVPTIREQGIAIPIIANVRGILGPPDMPAAAAQYWEDFFARLAKTASWRKYVEENQVEDVFLRGAEMTPFLNEQIDVMRRMLREAGVGAN